MTRQIEVADDQTVKFQIYSEGPNPGVIWLHLASGTYTNVVELQFEAMRSSGPFRMELHKGRQNPRPGLFSTPDVGTLHTICLSQSGEWDATSGWLQGEGVHCNDSAIEDPEGGDKEFFTFILFPLGKQAGAGVRCKVDDAAE